MATSKYGYRHQKLRRDVAKLVAAGSAICARCGWPIAPGAAWDLGHSDFGPNAYAGPEHRGCNRSAGALKKQGMLNNSKINKTVDRW